MKASKLIEKLQLIIKDLGDHPIEVRCDPFCEKLTVAMWQDLGDEGPYIKAIDMEKHENH